MSAYTHSGQVYFIACGPYVKIGYTARHIAHRLYALGQKSSKLICPADLDLKSQRPRVLRLIPGCVSRDEHRMHALFAAHHVIGEWFALTPAFLLQLERLEYVTDREVLANFREQRRLLKRAKAARDAA